jgi:hypothetical protein
MSAQFKNYLNSPIRILPGVGKKSQVSIFLIIGIVVLLVAAIFYIGNRYTPDKGLYNIMGVTNAKVYFEQYMSICVENAAKDAIAEYGIVNSQQELADYVELQVRQCVYSEEFMSEGYTITESTLPNVVLFMDENLIEFHLEYPLEFQADDSRFSITTVDYTINKRAGLDLVNNRVTPFITGMATGTEPPSRLILESGDGKAILRLPTNLKPEGFNYIYMRLVGEVQQDPSVLSFVAYDILPFALTFDNSGEEQVQLSISYSEKDIPTEVKEEDLTLVKFSFASDGWEEVESTVEVDSNFVIGPIDAGGRYAVGFKDACGKPKVSRKGPFRCDCAGGVVACYTEGSCQDQSEKQTSWCNQDGEEELDSVCGKDLGQTLDFDCSIGDEPGACSICTVTDSGTETRVFGKCKNTDYSDDITTEALEKGECYVDEILYGQDCIEAEGDKLYIREFYCYKEMSELGSQNTCGSTVYDLDDMGIMLNAEEYSRCGELCGNNQDDDNDGNPDCTDSDCIESPGCVEEEPPGTLSTSHDGAVVRTGTIEEISAFYPDGSTLERVYFAISPPNTVKEPSGDYEEAYCEAFEDGLKAFIGVGSYIGSGEVLPYSVASQEDSSGCPWDYDNSEDHYNAPKTARVNGASKLVLSNGAYQVVYDIAFGEQFPKGGYNIYLMRIKTDDSGFCEGQACWEKVGKLTVE